MVPFVFGTPVYIVIIPRSDWHNRTTSKTLSTSVKVSAHNLTRVKHDIHGSVSRPKSVQKKKTPRDPSNTKTHLDDLQGRKKKSISGKRPADLMGVVLKWSWLICFFGILRYNVLQLVTLNSSTL